MRMPAKISPPRQMTAPAYMAKVLKVAIKVVAPEKSIVPWARATLEIPANESATSVGAAVRRSCVRNGFEKVWANRLARGVVVWDRETSLRWDICTSCDLDGRDVVSR